MIYSLAFHLFLGMIIVLYEFLRAKTRPLDTMLFISISYFLLYVYVPVAIYFKPEWATVGAFKYNNEYSYSSLTIALISIFGYCLILGGRHYSQLLIGTAPRHPAYIDLSKKSFIILIIIGIISYLLYARALGGVFNSVILGSALRYGVLNIDEVVSGNGLVFKRLLSVLELLVFYSIARRYSGRKLTHGFKFLMRVVTVFYICFLLSSASRGAFIGLIVFYFYIRSRSDVSSISIARYVIFSLSALLFVLYGKQFLFAFPELLQGNTQGFFDNFSDLNSVRQKDGTVFMRDTLFKEFSNGYVSLIHALHNSSGLLYFRDYLGLPIDLLPMNLLGINLPSWPSISAINTYNLQGLLIASMPPGILAMSIYNLAVPGLFSLFIFGFLINYLEYVFKYSNGPLGKVLFFYTMLLSMSYVSNSDIKVLVFDSLFPFLFLFVNSLKVIKIKKQN